MSIDADDEILQDFLVEAGEILESLSEQLVELEQSPDDVDLLNAIFRGFHTIKGGAGFLQLNPLVDCCHIAENVFDMLRKQERSVTAELMDTVLNTLDSVNEMFDQVRQGEEPEDADPALLKALERLTDPEAEDEEDEAGDDDTESGELEVPVAANQPASDDPATAPAANDGSDPPLSGGDPGDDITDDEFEQLLDALEAGKQSDAAPPEEHGNQSSPAATGDNTETSGGNGSTSTPKDDEITEDEFENLLDQLHGEGKFDASKTMAGEASASLEEPEEPPETQAPPEKAAAASANDSDEISDDEFEALMDEIHGKGKFNAGVVEEHDQSAVKAKVEASTTEDSAKAGQPKTDKPVAKPAAKPEPEAKQAPAGKKTPAAKAADKKPGKSSDSKSGKSATKPTPDKQPITQETTVRVDTSRLDDIMNMVGELVLVRNRLVRLSESATAGDETSKAVSNLDVVTTDLQNSVMKTRMQPIKKVFGRFPRVVRDLARTLEKEINLEMVGEDTDLDKNLVEALADPLVHLVRNSVDHGIEMPDVREKNGKPRVGKVVLSAEQEGDHIMLSISDDGGGMDASKLRDLAVTRGVTDREGADRLSDKEAFNLIFAPGFSTKTEITDVSGRGVGMDVVKTKISQLNGFIDIDSEMGRGTTIRIKVPLTLAIMPTLMVTLGEQAFALPLVNVDEIFHLDLSKTNVLDGKEVVVVRGKALPLFYLKRWLVRGGNAVKTPTNGDDNSGHVVVVSVGTQKVGFVVDSLVGQEEVVIKPLGRTLHGTAGMAGATITGDGRIALILDVPSMLKEYA